MKNAREGGRIKEISARAVQKSAAAAGGGRKKRGAIRSILRRDNERARADENENTPLLCHRPPARVKATSRN